MACWFSNVAFSVSLQIADKLRIVHRSQKRNNIDVQGRSGLKNTRKSEKHEKACAYLESAVVKRHFLSISALQSDGKGSILEVKKVGERYHGRTVYF